MNQKNQQLVRLLSKQQRTLEEHLQEAIDKGLIGNCFLSPPKKRKNETIKQFAQRVADYSSSYQFVHIPFNGESLYVAFGVAGPIITPVGKFILIPAQIVGGKWGVHYFLFYPHFDAIFSQHEIFVRLDSGCTSGQIFGDITCDCREQLEVAFKHCVERECGIIINIPGHDGRGWGEYKMANQYLMDECDLDTVNAARMFYGDHATIDQRTYSEAVIILRAFGFSETHTFCLGTNNPRKVGAFISHGLRVESTQTIVPQEPNPILKKNIAAKVRKLGHTIDRFS